MPHHFSGAVYIRCDDRFSHGHRFQQSDRQSLPQRWQYKDIRRRQYIRHILTKRKKTDMPATLPRFSRQSQTLLFEIPLPYHQQMHTRHMWQRFPEGSDHCQRLFLDCEPCEEQHQQSLPCDTQLGPDILKLTRRRELMLIYPMINLDGAETADIL